MFQFPVRNSAGLDHVVSKYITSPWAVSIPRSEFSWFGLEDAIGHGREPIVFQFPVRNSAGLDHGHYTESAPTGTAGCLTAAGPDAAWGQLLTAMPSRLAIAC